MDSHYLALFDKKWQNWRVTRQVIENETPIHSRKECVGEAFTPSGAYVGKDREWIHRGVPLRRVQKLFHI